MTDCEDGVLIGSPARTAVPAWQVNYDARVMELNPLAYYRGNEKSGAVADDLTANEFDAAINGASWLYGQAGIGDGQTSLSPDSQSAHYILAPNDLELAMTPPSNMDELTWAAWLYVDDAADWALATDRYIFEIVESGPEGMWLRRQAGDSELRLHRQDGAGTIGLLFDPGAITGWFHLAVSASVAGNRMRLFYNGIQQGADQAPVATNGLAAIIPFGRSSGTSWFGRGAKIAWWGSELTPAQVLSIGVL